MTDNAGITRPRESFTLLYLLKRWRWQLGSVNYRNPILRVVQMTHKLPHILREHANSMWSEGWYTTANRLVEAADRIERLEEQLDSAMGTLEAIERADFPAIHDYKNLAHQARAKLGGEDAD